MFVSPGEIALSLGNITIHWYGIIIAVAFVTGLVITTKAAKEHNFDPDSIINISILLLLVSVIFARLYFVIFDWRYYKNHLNEIIMVWQGGLSIHGAIIGSVLFLLIYSKFKKFPLLKYTDIFSYGLIIGQSVGRWGNFFNSEAFGTPTSFPWGVYIPIERRPEKYIGSEYFHPTFLYESIWNFLVFLILYFFLRKIFEGKDGAITCSYLILYSFGRFIIEGIRTDSIYYLLGMPIAQFISIILIIIGAIGLYYVTVCSNLSRHQ